MTFFNARKDVNSVSTLCGVSDLDGSVMPVLIDPVTGGVLVEVTFVVNDTPVLSHGWAMKDVNSSSTLLGVADDGSGLLVPAMYQGTASLFVDMTTS